MSIISFLIYTLKCKIALLMWSLYKRIHSFIENVLWWTWCQLGCSLWAELWSWTSSLCLWPLEASSDAVIRLAADWTKSLSTSKVWAPALFSETLWLCQSSVDATFWPRSHLSAKYGPSWLRGKRDALGFRGGFFIKAAQVCLHCRHALASLLWQSNSSVTVVLNCPWCNHGNIRCC